MEGVLLIMTDATQLIVLMSLVAFIFNMAHFRLAPAKSKIFKLLMLASYEVILIGVTTKCEPWLETPWGNVKGGLIVILLLFLADLILGGIFRRSRI